MTELDVEDISNEMQFDSEDSSMTELDVEDISNEMQFDSEDSSMTEADVEDISNEMQFDSEDSSRTELDVEDISYEMQFDSEDNSMTEVDVEDISYEMQFDSEDSSMTEVDVEDISNEMQFDSEDSMTEVDVEDISNEMQFDSEEDSMTEVDVEDMSNITESARRRMRWSDCAVYKGSHSAQYLYIHGKCRHIQSRKTVYNWYGKHIYRKISQSSMNACRKGDPIKPGAWLMSGHGTNPVYAVFNGMKHHIASRSTFDRCRFNWGLIVNVPLRVVDGYPTGPSIRV